MAECISKPYTCLEECGAQSCRTKLELQKWMHNDIMILSKFGLDVDVAMLYQITENDQK